MPESSARAYPKDRTTSKTRMTIKTLKRNTRPAANPISAIAMAAIFTLRPIQKSVRSTRRFAKWAPETTHRSNHKGRIEGRCSAEHGYEAKSARLRSRGGGNSYFSLAFVSARNSSSRSNAWPAAAKSSAGCALTRSEVTGSADIDTRQIVRRYSSFRSLQRVETSRR
jgi:hypothetical protein